MWFRPRQLPHKHLKPICRGVSIAVNARRRSPRRRQSFAGTASSDSAGKRTASIARKHFLHSAKLFLKASGEKYYVDLRLGGSFLHFSTAPASPHPQRTMKYGEYHSKYATCKGLLQWVVLNKYFFCYGKISTGFNRN